MTIEARIPQQSATEENAIVKPAADTYDSDDDDDVTVIALDAAQAEQLHNTTNTNIEPMVPWFDQTGPEWESRRRSILLRELERVQKTSFHYFAILCCVPILLLIVVLATVVGKEEECASLITHCELEPRSFINAYTTRCICDAIPVLLNIDGDGNSNGE